METRAGKGQSGSEVQRDDTEAAHSVLPETQSSEKKDKNLGLPWWSSGWDSELPMQGVWGSIPGQQTGLQMPQ